ncbi:MAG: heme exporter protein CcmB [Saprospiraceae bacterium]|nr:heme exporter protein CcmB [Saprospiraceae bacterium]
MLQQILTLFRKEVLLEYRMSYAISGILLYVFSTVFVVYNALAKPDALVWNTIFWIIILFIAVNAIVKSFVQESGTRQIYYYTLASPLAVFIAKLVFNVLLLFVLSIIAYVVLAFFVGNPVKDLGGFISAIMLSSVGFSIVFTFISGISAKANNSATLLTILAFPLNIPTLLTLLKLSAASLRLFMDTSTNTDILILVAIDLLLFALAIVLFPFVWRD